MRPSEQLLLGRINGEALIAGSNAHETLMKPMFNPTGGYVFIPTNITTEDDVLAYLHSQYSYFPDTVYPMLQHFYPKPPQPDGLYDDMQGRIAAMTGEAVLNCASYWLVQAFPRQAYHYEWQSISSLFGSKGSSAGHTRTRYDGLVSREFPNSPGNSTIATYICSSSSLFHRLW
jgi:hypothetical protein